MAAIDRTSRSAGASRSVKITRFWHGQRAFGAIKPSNPRKSAASPMAWVRL
jgi:hypothetical protein